MKIHFSQISTSACALTTVLVILVEVSVFFISLCAFHVISSDRVVVFPLCHGKVVDFYESANRKF